MKRFNIIILLIVFFILFSIIAIYIKSNNLEKDIFTLKKGKYIKENNDLGHPNLIIKNKNEFILSISVLSSYIEYGDYKIDNNELILNTQNNDIYVFNINGDNLILKEGQFIKGVLEEGDVFNYIEDI